MPFLLFLTYLQASFPYFTHQTIYTYQDIKINISTKVPRSSISKTSKKGARQSCPTFTKAKSQIWFPERKRTSFKYLLALEGLTLTSHKRLYPLMRTKTSSRE